MIRFFRLLCLVYVLLPVQPALAEPQRIVALAPSAAELLLELDCGERIVGRSENCRPELETVPSVGPFHRPSLERVLALKPDLCVAVADGTPPALLRRLSEAGERTLTLDIRSFEDMLKELRRLGEILGKAQKADELAMRCLRRLERLESSCPAEEGAYRPSVLFLVQEKPPMAAAEGSFIAQLIERAGGVCAVAAQGNVLYPVLSREELARLAPELVLISGMASSAGRPPRRVEHVAGVPELAQSRIYLVDADAFTRPSLRALDALEQLFSILYKEEH